MIAQAVGQMFFFVKIKKQNSQFLENQKFKIIEITGMRLLIGQSAMLCLIGEKQEICGAAVSHVWELNCLLLLLLLLKAKPPVVSIAQTI